MDYGSALRALTENPNRRSSRYKKQSTFAGSNRQIRGNILRLISEEGKVPLKRIAGELKTSHDKLVNTIDQLCVEGFIKRKGRYVEMV
jgi:A/G-specific adenine glycosylase